MTPLKSSAGKKKHGASGDSEAAVERRIRKMEKELHSPDLPRHIAIIMDGNGRWAKKLGWMDRIRGHEKGVESVRCAAENCARLGIEALTLYAFSRENWQRPRVETSALMRLLRRFMVQERPTLMKNDIRLIVTGSLEDLPVSVRKTVNRTCRMTAENTGMVLNLALSYSAREEITEAARRLARQVAAGSLDPEAITMDMISENLYAPELGDPDLLIRTSGEMRISNFLLWQLAYSEIYVTDVLWPDFRLVHLLEACVNYQGRDRRFGKVKID